MAGLTVERRGIEDILSGYQLFEVPMFAVFVGKDLKFSYRSEDQEAGIQFLSEQLQAIRASNGSGIYTLKVYNAVDKDGYISNATHYVGSFNFKVCEADPYFTAGRQQMIQGAPPVPDKMAEILNRMDQRMVEIEKRLDEEAVEEEERHPAISIMDGIGSIGEKYPWLQNKIDDLFLLGRTFFKKLNPMAEGKINGIDPSTMTPQQKVVAALDILHKADTDGKFPDRLLKLAELSINDPDMYQVMIKKLDLL